MLGIITLLSALSISSVAIYYSVAGLASIFAAASTEIMIMGVTLEVGKLVITAWLHHNWHTAPKILKVYMIPAVMVLMLVTSMGIFGYLSKAHMDQTMPTGDVVDNIALIDEKLKIQKDNIETARHALNQMDASVDQTMARSTGEQGASRAVQIRRSQAKERAELQLEISRAQQLIAQLNEERAPIAKELRKVEAEVGPIKYIAAFFYGTTDTIVLEKAVTWLIMMLIFVFDPLAIVLLIAGQISLTQPKQAAEPESDSESETAIESEEYNSENDLPEITETIDIQPHDEQLLIEPLDHTDSMPTEQVQNAETVIDKHPIFRHRSKKKVNQS